MLTNKYAEGYPGKRYYGGCEWIDEVEQLAIDRAKELFGADHANVQPHAGGPANQAAYFALVEPGDPMLGLRLDHGGHLTHGLKVNFSGRLYDIHSYGVRREDSRIDFDEVRRLAKEYRPKLIIAGASAYPRVIDAAVFREIADEVGALLMVDMAHFAGLVAAGLHPNPVEHADVVTSTTHKTLAGPRSGMILSRQEHATAVDKAVFPGLQGGPLCHVVAAKAVCFKLAASDAFKAYQRQIVANAKALATDADGRRTGAARPAAPTCICCSSTCAAPSGRARTPRNGSHEVAITVNRNTVPFDERPPTIASGVRIGTPCGHHAGFDRGRTWARSARSCSRRSTRPPIWRACAPGRWSCLPRGRCIRRSCTATPSCSTSPQCRSSSSITRWRCTSSACCATARPPPVTFAS